MEPLSEVLDNLFATRGYGRLLAVKELEDAWNAAVGEPGCRQTRLGEVRRGILNVTVAHSTLLEELAAYRNPPYWPRWADCARDLDSRHRFRVGPIQSPYPPGLSGTGPEPPPRRPRDGQ